MKCNEGHYKRDQRVTQLSVVPVIDTKLLRYTCIHVIFKSDQVKNFKSLNLECVCGIIKIRIAIVLQMSLKLICFIDRHYFLL